MAKHTICSVEGCDKRHDARGYCSMHLTRFYKHGSPHGLAPPRRKERTLRECAWCGSKFEILLSPARAATGRGKFCSKSCGTSARQTKHGKHQSREYTSWASMKARCLNPNNSKYYMYGAKGISICDEWLEFPAFYRDMGDRPVGTTLDRIDPRKGYSKDNCRWATIYEQQNHVSTVRKYPFRGEMMTLTDIARLTGIRKTTLVYRVRNGWSDDQIASPPSRAHRESKVSQA